jgi:hypothetical protein
MGRIALVSAIFLSAYAVAWEGEEPHFPDGAFKTENSDGTNARAKLYSSYLRAMEEPSLWKLSANDHKVTVYRLLWVPSFHPVIAVRITRSGESLVLRAVRLEAGPSARPGKVLDRRTKKLSDDDWTLLQVYLEKCHYWTMKTVIDKGANINLDLDGDSLVCEGADRGKYHVVQRSGDDPIYEALCKFILALSGFDTEEAWKEHHG